MQLEEPAPGTVVQVYRNLNREGRVYSVRAKKTSRVIGYVESITLLDVLFRVREGGRRRTLEDRQRNVHAFAEGVVADPKLLLPWAEAWWLGNYNPYRGPTFFDVHTGADLVNASAAHLGPSGLHYCHGPVSGDASDESAALVAQTPRRRLCLGPELQAERMRRA